ncbi:integrin-like protein [Streptomyces scabiei]|uniref:integrin-like protein n=1 Tax=Streptomyces scabiei TaxID=1930 RepID=UPI0036EA1D63
MRSSRTTLLTTTLTTALATALLTTLPTASATAAPATYADDFDGDGYRDLAIGMPEQTVGGKRLAGSVLVTFGSAKGLTSRKIHVTQNSAGVPGAAEPQDRFGSALSSGDLDGDGYADLVVSSDSESVGGQTARGMVTVLWGGPKPFRSGTALAASPLSTRDGFLGNDVAVGDFVGDAAPDIAVADLTSVWLYEGSISRTATPAPVPAVPRGHDGIGIAQLAAGDFTGGGKDELAVTGPAATLVYAAGNTSTPTVEDFYNRRTLTGGESAATGDLNGDGRDDLAVGRFLFRTGNGLKDPSAKAGYVMVHYGSAGAAGGLAPQRHVYHQGTSGIPGGNEAEDLFGASLSIGDVTGDGRAELAIGVPYESLPRAERGGDVLLLRGGPAGLTTAGAKRFSQNTPGIPGAAEHNDVFGSQLRLVDFDRDRKADLAVSAPYEDPYRNEGSGAVWQLHGTGSGLTVKGADVFGPKDYGIPRGSGLGIAFNR